jgi:hypothetical protein
MLYLGVFKPLYLGQPGIVWTPEFTIGGLQASDVQYQNTINLVEDVKRKMEKINKEYLAVGTTTTNRVETMLPDSINPIRLQNEVVSIANAAGVSLQGLTIKEDGKLPVPGTGAYLITFTMKARYPVIKAVLEAYEKNLRVYSTESFNIDRQDPEGLSDLELKNFDKEALVAAVSYKVYYLKK